MELRIVLKRREDILAFRRVQEEMRGAGVNNVEAVRRLVACFHELRELKERMEREKKEKVVEPGVEELNRRLGKAQQLIADIERQMGKQEEYIRAAEEHLVQYVLGRKPRRVWRLNRVLEAAFRRKGPFEAVRMRRSMGFKQSLFAKDLKELTELGLLERLDWGVYRINYFKKEELIREMGRRMVRREIEKRVEKKKEAKAVQHAGSDDMNLS